MGEEEEASPIPIPICQKIREASPISIPTRPDFCWDIIPLEISRLSEYTADMGEEDRGGLPDPDPNLSKNRGGLPYLDLDPTRFLSRYYPPRDISPIAGMG